MRKLFMAVMLLSSVAHAQAQPYSIGNVAVAGAVMQRVDNVTNPGLQLTLGTHNMLGLVSFQIGGREGLTESMSATENSHMTIPQWEGFDDQPFSIGILSCYNCRAKRRLSHFYPGFSQTLPYAWETGLTFTFRMP